jgi:membrane dipeptidase
MNMKKALCARRLAALSTCAALFACAVAAVAANRAAAATGAAPAGSDYHARVIRVLEQTPLIDGHNDLAWEIRDRYKSRLASIDLKTDTSKLPVGADMAPLMTDIVRLRAGHVGGQFWSVWVPVDVKGP